MTVTRERFDQGMTYDEFKAKMTRTREQLDSLAEEISEAGRAATLWLAAPGSAGQEREIATAMRAARATQYQAVATEAARAHSIRTATRAEMVSTSARIQRGQP